MSISVFLFSPRAHVARPDARILEVRAEFVMIRASNMPKTIGILGGLGPASSAHFYGRLISVYKSRFKPTSNFDFPHIILNSISVPDLIDGDNSIKLEAYLDGLKMLEPTSDFLVIVCNSAHVYYDYFAKHVSKPIIDLRAEVKNELLKRGAKKVTVLATPTSIDAGLYLCHDFEYNTLSNDEVRFLGNLIKKLNIGDYVAEDVVDLQKLFRKYEDVSDVVILGCTEIADVLNDYDSKKKVDTMDVLLHATLREYAK